MASITFSLNGIKYKELTKYEACVVKSKYSGNIIIPNEIKKGDNSYKVISIGNGAFKECTEVLSVVLPDTITSISDFAFEGCTKLKSINLPQSIISIGQWAFIHCENIESLEFPDKIEIINGYTCEGCLKLSKVSLPKNLKKVESGAFRNCPKLKALSFPQGVTNLGANSFAGTGITSITLPRTISTIYWDTFSYCSELEEFNAEEGISIFGGISDCPKVTSVKIPSSVTTICGFDNCIGLKSIDLPEGLKIIGSHSFMGCVNLESIIIPSTITLIDRAAFSNCEKLGHISIPDCFRNFGADVFKNTEWFNSQQGAVVVNGVLIGYNGSGNALIPEGVEIVGRCAFWERKDIVKVDFPKSVKIICSCAFGKTEHIELTINEELETIDEDAFWFASDFNLFIPKNSKLDIKNLKCKFSII